MFIRETITVNKKTGAKYTKHSLEESIRVGGVPRQRTFMHLGSLSLPKSQSPKLAAILEAKLAGPRSLGPELVANTFWERLGVLAYHLLICIEETFVKKAIPDAGPPLKTNYLHTKER